MKNENFGFAKLSDNPVNFTKLNELKQVLSEQKVLLRKQKSSLVHSESVLKDLGLYSSETSVPINNGHLKGSDILMSIFTKAPKDKIIIGRDFDSILCGILLNKVYGSKVVGFFDTTTLKIDKNYVLKECFFVDIEILKEGYYSIGNHLNCIHKDCYNPGFLRKISGCVNANLVNRINAKSRYTKYPFSSIVLLLFLLEKEGISLDMLGIDIEYLKNIVALADGTLNTIYNYNYTDNAYRWTTDFFGGSEVSKRILLPLFSMTAFEKRDIESFFKNGDKKFKTSIPKTKCDEQLKPYIVSIHRQLGITFDEERWIMFGDNMEEHKFSDRVGKTTKKDSLGLYHSRSNMITSCIRQDTCMVYTADVNKVM